MIVSGVEIPKDLLNAIESNNLVVFVGAGASMGYPTQLPSFDKLVELIESGTGEHYHKGEPCEKYLGRLKHKHIDVHKKAANLLSEKKLKHNDLHKFIIDLFESVETIKIVTTNYDTMFEQVLESRGHNKINVYNAPALPLGNNFKGIVHIHGNVQDPESMILTDEDFGKAYITEGYVSRFLIKLFESYNVLFIGYSYNDTIVKYLTRAITTYGHNKRFILIESESKEFDLLGIQSICYGENKFDTLYKIVNHLGEVNHRRLLDWQNTIREYEFNPPKDISLESEIEYCLYDEKKSFVLSKTIHGEKWFEWLLQRGIFDSIFNANSKLTENDEIWLDWFVDEFFCQNDSLIKRMILRYNNNVNDSLIRKIVNKLDNNQLEISNQDYCEYIILFQDKIDDGLTLQRLIESSYGKKLYELSFILFKKMFDFKMIIRNKLFSPNDEIEYECKFLSIDDFIDITWENVGIHLAEAFPIEFLRFVREKINSIYEQYQVIGMANNNKDPLNNFLFSLERKHYYTDSENVLFLLCDGVCKVIAKIEKENYDLTKRYIFECLQSKSILLKNLGIKLLRVSTSFSYDEKCNNLLKFVDIYATFEKEQVYLLVANIFNCLSDFMQEKLLDEINKGNTRLERKEENIKTIAYEKFNWCIWLEKNDIKKEKIKEIKDQVLLEFPYFKERKHPELIAYGSIADWSFDRSPKSEKEIMEMKEDDLITLLKEFKEDKFRDITKEGLYNTFSNCLKNDFQWSFDILSKIIKSFDGDHPIWTKIIPKVSESEYTIEQHMNLLRIFIENSKLVKFNDLYLAWYIEKLLEKSEVKSQLGLISDQLFDFSMQIYELGEKKVYWDSEVMTKCLNCSIGILLMFWVKLLSMETELSKENKYYDLFEKLLNEKSQYQDQILCVLVGNVRFFYYKNLEWCKKYIIPYITSKDSDEFVASWEGIAYYSSALYKDFAYDYQNEYLEAITRINELNGHGREILVRQYTLLLVYVVDEPLKHFIPVFFKFAEKQDKLMFVHTIKDCLNDLDNQGKENLWFSWLKEYWINRINNIPIGLEDEESTEMLNWCLKLNKLFPEAVQVIVDGMNLKKISNSFIFRMIHSDVIQNYPDDVAKLMIYILNNDVEIVSIEYRMKELIRCLNITDSKIKSDLNEALLNRHIFLDLI